MINTNTDLKINNGDSISGEFVAKNPKKRVSQNSKPYLLFEIRPDLLPVKVIIWKSTFNIFHGQKVGIEGNWRPFNGNWQIHASTITNLNRETQKVNQAKVHLRALLSWIPNTTLRQFLIRVMNDVNIIDGFSTAPASLRHHHAYPGGLLVHSVETAWHVFNNQQLPNKDRYLGVIAALLHDIGKIKTMSYDMTRKELGNLVHHESLSLEILAPHLKWLDDIDRELSSSIRYLLTWKKKSYDPIPKLDVYEVIKMADRISAGSD